jgi:hypothetical protein
VTFDLLNVTFYISNRHFEELYAGLTRFVGSFIFLGAENNWSICFLLKIRAKALNER